MPLTINKPLSAQEAARAKNPELWRGWFRAEIRSAAEKESKRGNATIELWLAVFHAEQEREYRDWLTAADRVAEKLRHACEAVGVLAQYESGELSAEMFAGHACQVRLEIEKGRAGFPARSAVVDYKPAEASGVVNLRAAS